MDICIKTCFAGQGIFQQEGQTDHKRLSCMTVVQCLSGCYEVFLGTEHFFVREGEIFYTPEHIRQTIIHHLPDNGPERVMRAQWVYLNVLVNQKYNLPKYAAIPHHFSAEDSREMGCYLTGYIDTSASEGVGVEVRRNFFAYGILDQLLSYSHPIPSHAIHKLEPVLQQIEENLEQELSLEEISRRVNYSSSYLYRLFQEELGMSPQQYIVKQKLLRACTLLLESDMTVRAISDSLGFCDQFHFSRRFRQEFRCSPTEYRKNYSYFR